MKTNFQIQVLKFTFILVSIGFAEIIQAQSSGPNNLGSDNANSTNISKSATLENTAYTFYIKGIAFDNDSNYENAIIELTKAINLNPNYSEAYDRRGMVYVKMIKYNKALKDFNRAIKINPLYAEAYNHRGIVLYCLKEFEAAINDYTTALDIEPTYAKVYYNRGIVKLEMSDDIGAEIDFTKASQLKVEEATRFLSMEND
jgi:tetratricopeptide (TPR) repeat protein